MKKILSVLLTVVLSFTLFTACKQDDSGTGGGNGGSNYSTYMLVEGVEKSAISLINGSSKVELEVGYSGSVSDKTTTWSASKEGVVDIKTKKALPYVCEITPKTAGETVITATSANGKTCSVTVTVTDAVITATKTTFTLYACDKNYTINLKNYLSTNYGSLKYSSSNESVVKVSTDGVLTAVNKGKTTVTVTVKENIKVKKELQVSVNQNFIDATTTEVYLLPNEELNLPFVTEVEGVTYATANSSIATVVGNKIKGLAVGETTLTASYNNDSVTVKVYVVATKASSYTVKNDLFDEMVNYYGRNYYYSNKSAMAFSYGASGFEVSFYGTTLKANLINIYNKDASHLPYVQVLVDGEKVPTNDLLAKKFIIESKTATEYTLVSGLTEGFHTVKVLKRSGFLSGTNKESVLGLTSFSTDGFLNKAPQKPTLKIEVIGDSITHGYGNLAAGATTTSATTNSLLNYAYLAAEKLGAQIYKQGHSGWGVVYRSSGAVDTNTQWYNTYNKTFTYNGSSFTSSTWNYANYQPDIVVINLGTNDSAAISQGNYSSDTFKNNYKAMIEGIKQKAPNAKFILAYGMMGTNSTVMADINSVANAYNYVYSLNFTDFRSSNGHPLVENHVSNSNELYNKIIEVLG